MASKGIVSPVDICGTMHANDATNEQFLGRHLALDQGAFPPLPHHCDRLINVRICILGAFAQSWSAGGKQTTSISKCKFFS